MNEQLSRRCALVIFAAMGLALLAGMLAWGPIGVDARHHRYADGRAWLGVPNASNVLASLLLSIAGAWGWLATRASRWPTEMRQAWMSFHVCAAAAGLLTGVYHLAPTDLSYLLAHVVASGAFTLLAAGVLAERVHARFGSARALTAVVLVVLAAASLVGVNAARNHGVDLRPLALLEALPLLLIPSGVLSLPGIQTRHSDWMLLLLAYAAAKLFDLADAKVFSLTGWVGGHALMHLTLAVMTARLAYCAAAASTGDACDAPTQRQTSLNTAG